MTLIKYAKGSVGTIPGKAYVEQVGRNSSARPLPSWIPIGAQRMTLLVKKTMLTPPTEFGDDGFLGIANYVGEVRHSEEGHPLPAFYLVPFHPLAAMAGRVLAQPSLTEAGGEPNVKGLDPCPGQNILDVGDSPIHNILTRGRQVPD